LLTDSSSSGGGGDRGAPEAAAAAAAAASDCSSRDGRRGTPRPAADANWRLDMTRAFPGPESYAFLLLLGLVLALSQYCNAGLNVDKIKRSAPLKKTWHKTERRGLAQITSH